MLMRRKTDRTRQDKNRLQQLRRLSFTIRPMIEATHLRVFWVSRICRYRWLIRLTFPHLGIASLAQVSKTGLCPLPEISLANYCKKGSLGHHVQVCKHTHTHICTHEVSRIWGFGYVSKAAHRPKRPACFQPVKQIRSRNSS